MKKQHTVSGGHFEKPPPTLGNFSACAAFGGGRRFRDGSGGVAGNRHRRGETPARCSKPQPAVTTPVTEPQPSSPVLTQSNFDNPSPNDPMA